MGDITKFEPGGRKKRGGGVVGYDRGAFNREFAVLMAGDRVVILQEWAPRSSDDPGFRFLSVNDFKVWTAVHRVWSEEKERFEPASGVWLLDKERRQFRGVDFAPSGTMDGVFNLWRGFAVDPAPPGRTDKCQRLLDHVYENVCAENDDLFAWVMGWFAHAVQRPDERPGTALVLRGRQGTGKTTLGEAVGRLFGSHYFLVDDPRYLVGQFNAHLIACLLLQVDEGFWAGDKGAEGRLKGLVTSGHQMIEKKGIDPIRVKNLVRLMVTSNHDWVVPAGMEERRFCVLDVSDARMQDHDYFGALWRDLDAGGDAQLLRYLLDFDLAVVDVRKIPSTEALAEQKLESLTPEEGWWFARLRDGTVLPGHSDWQPVVECAALSAAYRREMQDIGVRRSKNDPQLGRVLRNRLVPGLGRRKEQRPSGYDQEGNAINQRRWCYEFPPLEDCRAHFDALMGGGVRWDE